MYVWLILLTTALLVFVLRRMLGVQATPRGSPGDILPMRPGDVRSKALEAKRQRPVRTSTEHLPRDEPAVVCGNSRPAER